MVEEKEDHKPNIILSILNNKCPRCRRGDMYQLKGAFRIKGLMRMNDNCPVCGQHLDMEPGFYYGTNMISYTLALLVSVLSLILWIIVIGVSVHDTRVLWWIAFNAVLLVFLQPPLMRLSRTVWISFFVPYSSKWKEGDIVEQFSETKDHTHNW